TMMRWKRRSTREAHMSSPTTDGKTICRETVAQQVHRNLSRERRDREVASALPAYHYMLAVNRNTTGFRGINGASPRGRGSPPFIPRPAVFRLTAARVVIGNAHR